MNQVYADTAHLFRRAGFGGLHSEIEANKDRPWPELVDLVLDVGRAPASPPDPDFGEHRGFVDRWNDMVHYWINQASRPVDQAPIIEKMNLFWHGLLCSSVEKLADPQASFDQYKEFRSHGLGNYDNLLHRISKGPAMLRYLDNEQNVAGNPNENLARELMELFVTGVGHYSEEDVRQSARAWTGHGADRFGPYQFRSDRHDWGTKSFMGETGAFDGPDIIDILFRRRRSVHARFMSMRLWSFFAFPVGLNDPVVADIMAAYQPSLDITAAVRAIFLHPQFRSERARTGLIRSPFEYTVAALRHTRVGPADARPEWYLPMMGQAPFHPPDVSGWGQNDYWITTSAAWAKIRLASRLRWHVFHRDDLTGVDEIVNRNPVRFSNTPDEAVDLTIDNYQIGPISPSSRRVLLDYIESERSNGRYSNERTGLLMLPLVLPEVQLA